MFFSEAFHLWRESGKNFNPFSIRTFHKTMALLIFYPTIYSFGTSLFVFVATASYTRRSVTKSKVRLSMHKFLSVL